MTNNTEKKIATDFLIKNYDRILSLDLHKIFQQHLNNNIDAYYIDREDRNRFAAEQIKTFGITNVLNIGGGGKRHLQSSLGQDYKVFEIDIVGDCDLELNLDRIDRLPFEDNTFDLCCAFDVLEHLEQFHLMNDELYRVSKSTVLIALPNSVEEIFPNVFLRNRPQQIPDLNRGTFSKFYGLPLQVPYDRHRWWLYFQDIIRFYYYFAQKNQCHLEFWTVKSGLKRRILGSIIGRHLHNTFLLPYIWIKLIKPKPTTP
jgi:hypothetical protein